ncbi:MAG: hypothetical protein ACP5OP_09040 [Leptospirillia bacterium]
MFDTHTYVKKLELAGFTETQAEVQVEALSAVLEEIKETLATKDDLLIMEERLTGQNRSLEERLTGQNRSLEERLTGQMNTRFAQMDAQFHSLEERLTGQMNTRFAQMDAQFHSLEERLTGQMKSSIAESQNTTLKWIIGLFVTLLGVFIALLKIH